MGQKDRPDSEHEVKLRCLRCGERYWTDTEQANDCPYCGHTDFDMLPESLW